MPFPRDPAAVNGGSRRRCKLAGLLPVVSAGGATLTAQPDRVVPVRYCADGSHSRWLLDLGCAMIRTEHADAQLTVLPGDVIYVPKCGEAPAKDVVDPYCRRMLPLTIAATIAVWQ